MSTPKQVPSDLDRHSIGDAIKDAMARRRVKLRELSKATGIPYRSLQNYCLGTSAVPAPALARIAEALDVSADWLLLGTEPKLDKETIEVVLEFFDSVVRPEMDSKDRSAAADAFLKLYEYIYIHHFSLPGVKITVEKRAQPTASSEEDNK